MDVLNASINLVDLATVVNNVVGGLILLILSAIVSIVVTIYVFNRKRKKAEESKQKDKLEQWIETHNTDLINNVFKPWYSHKSLFNWYDIPKQNITEFKEFLQTRFGIEDTQIVEITRVDPKTARVFFNETFLSLYLNSDNTKLSIETQEGRTEEFNANEENDKINIYEITSINGRKESLALEHFKKYIELWELRKEILTIQDNILSCKKSINEYILTRLEQSPSLNFARGCSSNEDDVVMFIYNTIKDYSNAGEVIDYFKFLPQINFNQNDEELIEQDKNYRKQIELIIKDKNLNEMISNVIADKVLMTKKTNEFEQGVEKIVYCFDNKHIPLNGTCEICESWHKKLKSLK
jgi:hypothetical protein